MSEVGEKSSPLESVSVSMEVGGWVEMVGCLSFDGADGCCCGAARRVDGAEVSDGEKN